MPFFCLFWWMFFFCTWNDWPELCNNLATPKYFDREIPTLPRVQHIQQPAKIVTRYMGHRRHNSWMSPRTPTSCNVFVQNATSGFVTSLLVLVVRWLNIWLKLVALKNCGARCFQPYTGCNFHRHGATFLFWSGYDGVLYDLLWFIMALYVFFCYPNTFVTSGSNWLRKIWIWLDQNTTNWGKFYSVVLPPLALNVRPWLFFCEMSWVFKRPWSITVSIIGP